jgi:hypothetical protein
MHTRMSDEAHLHTIGEEGTRGGILPAEDNKVVLVDADSANTGGCTEGGCDHQQLRQLCR